MTAAELGATRSEPPVTEVTQPFWDATRDRRLVLQWSTTCGRPVQYPREVCPYCASSAMEWRPATGFGTLYAFTVEHKMASPLLGREGPYAVALVELDEGVRLLSNIVDCAMEDLEVGMALQVTWEPLGDGRHLPQFQPRSAGTPRD